ncbi:hypothetical protein VMCG_04693 [Cytospora schulzeri]|uniref:BZIP domain-containing protein n=1 Tax=Cytospora schulzeri TaxID=448051 RepID=A0A423WRA7_9PEZI|nr:hypothetical protein VMCG_04693 [Valsa malicola]
MPSGSSKHHSSSSSSSKHGSSSKHQPKSDDWSDVTEPDERRRIQNRIAQRKFREKAREQKERQEREARNQELAGNSYQVPVPDDFMSMGDDQLSGVPWGGLNLQHMVAMGHESESRRGSRRETSDQYDYAGADSQFYDAQLMSPYGGDMAYGGDDRYFDHSGSSPSYSFFDTGHDSFSGHSSSSSNSSRSGTRR